MSDEYDVIVEKTVRDLFKSTPLIQIKKYKMNKEKEIMNKDDELKKLILEKYSSLIKSIDALEQISTHLNELQNIRGKLGENLSQLKFNEVVDSLQKIKFDDNFIEGDEEEKNNNKIDFECEYEKISSLIEEKKFDEVIVSMISLKENLNEEDNIESYHFILIDLCESIMNTFISDKNINDNIDQYKQMLDDIKQKLIINEESYEKLKLSEFYLKISYDENIKEIFDNYFVYDDSDNFSTNLLIKLLLLKICQNLFLLSQCKDSLFICDDNITRINELYRMLLSVSILSKTYLFKDNNELYKEKISNFINFIKNEITTNISTLLVISNTVNDNMSVKCDELISFWNRLFTALNMNISDSERKINEDISSLLFDNKNTLQCYLLSNKCLDQISNVSTLLLKLYNETNFTKVKIKKNNLIVKVFKEISVFDSDSTIKAKILSVISNQVSELLSKALSRFASNNSNEYMNFIMKAFSNSELQEIFSNLSQDKIIDTINQISLLYLQSNFTQIETFTNETFKKYLHYENYSLEDSNTNTVSISDSLKELLIFFYTFEIKDETYKVKIYNDINKVYDEIIKENNSFFNNKLLVDINLLNNLLFKSNHKEELTSYDTLISFIENKYKIQNNYSDDIEIIGKKELNDFFSNAIYYETEISFPFSKQMKNVDMKYNIYKKEQVQLNSNKLNPFMLQKRKVLTSKQNFISLSKILDLRIDENYLSVRNVKSQGTPNNQNQSNVKITSTLSQLGGKLFNLNK